MSAVCGGEQWTVEEHVFYSLKGLAALASCLFWDVMPEEAMRVLSGRVAVSESQAGRNQVT